MSKTGARQYIVVKECEQGGKTIKLEHVHIIEPDGRVFCHAVGEWSIRADEQPKPAMQEEAEPQQAPKKKEPKKKLEKAKKGKG